MGTILGALADLGYGVAYRVLDAQNFGVPQRRRRVFFVGHLGDECAGEVLALTESLFGNPPASREAGQDVASDAVRSADGATRPASLDADVTTEADTPAEPYVIKSAAIGRAPENGPQYGEVREDGSCYTLNCTEVHAVAFAQNTRDEVRLQGGDGQIVGALSSQPGMKQTTYLKISELPVSQRVYATDGTSATLSANGGGAGAKTGLYNVNSVVRRLTPKECERLLSWPDEWTRFGQTDGGVKEMSDSARYKACGNGAVVRAVAERIAA